MVAAARNEVPLTPHRAPTVTLAIDVMGSDAGAAEVVRGAAKLSLDAPHVHSVLVGVQVQIAQALESTQHHAERISVHHTDQVIAMHEKPGQALVQKPAASVLEAARLVAQGDADALVSAGNTGAGILACARHFQLLPGVRRAALAAVYPTRQLHGEKADVPARVPLPTQAKWPRKPLPPTSVRRFRWA
ncbi:MAG: hypothetical protein ACKVPX_07180 [Myxococcaceae bacterium]